MIQRLDWKDEELNPLLINGEYDGEPRYDLLDSSNTVIAEKVKLELRNSISKVGTRHNAANMNKLLQKCEVCGSFYYDGNEDFPDYVFPTPVSGSGWENQTTLSTNVGQYPIMFKYKNKIHATCGRLNGEMIQTVTIYDKITGQWSQTGANSTWLGNGMLCDHKVIGNKLYVLAFHWGNGFPTIYYLNVLNLDTLTWTFNGSSGSGIGWKNYTGHSPCKLSPDGQTAYVFGSNYDDSEGNSNYSECIGYFTMGDATVHDGGSMPLLDEGYTHYCADVVYYNGKYILMGLEGTSCTAYTGDLMSSNYEVRYDFLDSSLLKFLGYANGNLYLTSLISNVMTEVMPDFTTSLYDFGTFAPSHNISSCAGDKIYFVPCIYQIDSLGLFEFDAVSKEYRELQNPPFETADYGLFAESSESFYVLGGNTGNVGELGVTSSGVYLGEIFEGMSVSSNMDLFLTNSTKGKTVKRNRWETVDGDYKICCRKGAPSFGQITNL